MAWNIGWLVSCDKANYFLYLSKSWLQSASSVCQVRWEEKKKYLIAVGAWFWHQWTYKIPISLSMLILSPALGHEWKGQRVPSRNWSCPVVCLELKEGGMSFRKNMWLIVFYLSHLNFIVQPDLGKSRWSAWSLELEEGEGTSCT